VQNNTGNLSDSHVDGKNWSRPKIF